MATAGLFDAYAERYDGWYAENRVVAASEILAARRALEGSSPPCLEVGVGSGFFASNLQCTYGVDPSIEMLRIAVERGVEAILARGEALPVAPDTLGAVLLVVTICFADDPILILREALRVLREGGVIVSCVVPRDSPWGRLYASRARRGHPLYSAARFYTVDEVKSMLARAGLAVEEVIATLSYPPWARPRLEKPRPYTGREGFACIKARKPRRG